MQRGKFQVQQKLMDFTSKIQRVIEGTKCEKHFAHMGEPCFIIFCDSSTNALSGICGKRSRMYFTGQISDFAIRRGPKKERK